MDLGSYGYTLWKFTMKIIDEKNAIQPMFLQDFLLKKLSYAL